MKFMLPAAAATTGVLYGSSLVNPPSPGKFVISLCAMLIC